MARIGVGSWLTCMQELGPVAEPSHHRMWAPVSAHSRGASGHERSCANLQTKNYGLNFLATRNYTALQCPFMMSKDVMAATAQLEDFE